MLIRNPGIHPVRVPGKRVTRVLRHRIEVHLSRLAPANRPDESILLKAHRTEQLGQAPTADMPPDLHLPHALLGVRIALRQEQVVRVVGNDPEDAVLIATDGDRGMESRNADRTAGLREAPPGDRSQERDHADQGDHDDCHQDLDGRAEDAHVRSP